MTKQSPEKLRTDFWLADSKQGGVIRSQYDEIKSVIFNSDMRWVQKQYLLIKQHAIKQTEYYRDFSEGDEFPVMNKMSLLEFYKAHTAKEGFSTPIHISSTSGSTGTPFAVIQDYRKRKRTIADLKVFGEFCDYPSHERMIFFRVINSTIHRTPEQEERENIYYVDSSSLGEEQLNEMIQAILDKKPRIIFSYSSTLVELAKFIISLGIKSDSFSMKSVLTGGEGISEENRKMLEHVFGCRVYRRYSDMELGILGQDMGDGGVYMLNWGSYYFECLKMDSDLPAPAGEVGRIVITDLFNYAFPMIRYDTGDLGIMEYSIDGKFPHLKSILGRSRDCVYTVDGKLISPAKISVMMWNVKGIKQWQFIQQTKEHYTLKINGIKDMNFTTIIKNFKELLGEKANIEIQIVNDIPVTSSNKRRAIICHYKKGSY